jgi:hypothetical protein
MAKCPYCAYETPEPDDGDSAVRAWQEVAHMQTEHMDVIHERLGRFGLLDLPTRLREDDN